MDLLVIRKELEAYADWCRAQTARGSLVMYCAQCAGEMLVTDRKLTDGKTDALTFTCQLCQRVVTV